MISVTNSDKGSFTMKFSTRDRYALRLMVELANRPNDLIPLKDISDKQRISLKYLEQIVPILNKSGFLKTNRGYQGGYMLAKPPRQYTVGDILRLTEGDLAPVPCAAQDPADCPRSEDCATLPVWRGLNRVINEYLDGITLQDLLDQQRAHYANDYMI